LKKALLIIDRGSREEEVRHELEQICELAKHVASYDYVDYCFLEVVPPFITEGIDRCIANGADFITVMPYFLYPGMKLKDAVKQSAMMSREKNIRVVITKPFSYHPMMAQLVQDGINRLKRDRGINYPDSECNILLIGHGSSDKNAHDAFIFTANAIRPYYRNVHICFLELDKPDIEEGLKQAIEDNPKVILMMPYFLHKGTHIKKDVINDVKKALEKHEFNDAFLGFHIGVDEKLIEIVIERAREVEKRVGL
jgi:precorrin-8X/cobalt-precorrin-8 methylmutase